MGNSVSICVRQAAANLREHIEAVAQRLSRTGNEEAAYRDLAAAIDQCLGDLATTGLWGPDNRLPSSELWNAVGELLCRGWLQNQARLKPRGYAGDYEMLARIFEKKVCDDPLGRHFDRYFQEQAAPRAVRNRMKMMEAWIVERLALADRAPQESHVHGSPLRLAIVGSAFGLEVRGALASLAGQPRRPLVVTLVDMDPAALDFAREQLEPLLQTTDRLAAIPTNVFRLAERPRLAVPLEATDLLLCPGLFDYLDDAQAAAVLRVFWERLSPGGRLVVFQFAPNNPTRAYMEWLGNWYLVYRDRGQLHGLAEAAGIPREAAELGAEKLGVDLYLAASRAA